MQSSTKTKHQYQIGHSHFIVALFYFKLALNLSEDNFKLSIINSIFVLENEMGLIDN